MSVHCLCMESGNLKEFLGDPSAFWYSVTPLQRHPARCAWPQACIRITGPFTDTEVLDCLYEPCASETDSHEHSCFPAREDDPDASRCSCTTEAGPCRRTRERQGAGTRLRQGASGELGRGLQALKPCSSLQQGPVS